MSTLPESNDRFAAAVGSSLVASILLVVAVLAQASIGLQAYL